MKKNEERDLKEGSEEEIRSHSRIKMQACGDGYGSGRLNGPTHHHKLLALCLPCLPFSPFCAQFELRSFQTKPAALFIDLGRFLNVNLSGFKI